MCLRIAEHAWMQAKVVAGDRRSGCLCLASSSRRKQASHVASGEAHGAHFRHHISFCVRQQQTATQSKREILLFNELSMRGCRRRRRLGAAGAAARARPAVL